MKKIVLILLALTLPCTLNGISLGQIFGYALEMPVYRFHLENPAPAELRNLPPVEWPSNAQEISMDNAYYNPNYVAKEEIALRISAAKAIKKDFESNNKVLSENASFTVMNPPSHEHKNYFFGRYISNSRTVSFCEDNDNANSKKNYQGSWRTESVYNGYGHQYEISKTYQLSDLTIYPLRILVVGAAAAGAYYWFKNR